MWYFFCIINLNQLARHTKQPSSCIFFLFNETFHLSFKNNPIFLLTYAVSCSTWYYIINDFQNLGWNIADRNTSPAISIIFHNSAICIHSNNCRCICHYQQRFEMSRIIVILLGLLCSLLRLRGIFSFVSSLTIAAPHATSWEHYDTVILRVTYIALAHVLLGSFKNSLITKWCYFCA